MDSSLAAVSVCTICNKAFTRDHQFRRHVGYCRSAQARRKGRPKACSACKASKMRCDFAKPHCSRCAKRGSRCSYDIENETQPTLTSALALSSPVSFPVLANDLADPVFTDTSNLGLGAFEDFIGGVIDWTESGLSGQTPAPSTSSSADDVIARSRAARALTPISQHTAPARHAANLIAGIVGAFPEMMLRRHSFPPFIHPHWHAGVLPEILASCMSIAQLFVTRTEDTRAFLWRAVDAEVQRFEEQINTADATELQQAVQAATIYIVMAIVDQDDATPARGARIMQTVLGLKLQIQRILGQGSIASRTDMYRPSSTWEDWIFAESQRRIACFWFVITRVFALKTEKAQCPSLDNYLSLPLLSSKTLWEARTREEWNVEKCIDELNYPLCTFGELLDAQALRKDPGYARKLNNWEVGVDKLGTMMSIAMELVA